MKNPFEAAIKILLREELRFVDPPNGIGAAIRVLEAAGKVDKKSALALLDEAAVWGNAEGENWQGEDSFRALLESLPDEPKEKKDAG